MEILTLNCFCPNNSETGNSAGVVVNFLGDDTEKQKLALDLQLPVTVFISHCNEKEPTLRFFYKKAEMPLCIHGTLAAVAVLLDKRKTHTLTCLTKNGTRLTIIKPEFDLLQLQIAAAPSTIKLSDCPPLLEMLNLKDLSLLDQSLPLCISSVGSPKLLIPLISLQALASLKPNFDHIIAWSNTNEINGLYVYVKNNIGEASDFQARGFNPRTGHNEDAGTGVAAAALALALKRSIKVAQGAFINSPCLIQVTYINDSNILVGGKISSSRKHLFF